MRRAATWCSWPEARTAFIQAVQAKRFDADFHRNLALVAIQLEDYDLALAELDWSGPALALEFYDFNDQAARAFQINGLLLQNKTFRLHLVARPDPEPLYSSYLMDCPACHSRLRIQSRGYHACPRCGHHFPTSASKPGSDLCAYN